VATQTRPVGAPVIDRGGRHGHIGEAPPSATGERYVLVEFGSDGPQLLLPEDLLEPRSDGSFHLPMDAEALARQQPPASKTGGDTTVIPMIAEQARVTKRLVETGRVRVRKVVREEEEVVDEPLTRVRAEIERKPINDWVETLPPVRTEGETVIVPVVEEVLVVTRRLRLVEEVRISQREETFRSPQRVTLRREEAVIERLGPDEERPDEERDRPQDGEEPASPASPQGSGPAA
jgi:uncharacterized protein (TIGR02271 family)